MLNQEFWGELELIEVKQSPRGGSNAKIVTIDSGKPRFSYQRFWFLNLNGITKRESTSTKWGKHSCSSHTRLAY